MATNAPFGAYPRLSTDASGNTVLVGADGVNYAAIPAGRVIPVGSKAGIQTAIDSITDNLPVNHNTGTVSVTNGSATITFSASPANDKVVAGRDLFSVDGVRYYRIKSGPTTLGGAIFTLHEVYQGSTDAAASFSVYKPNPVVILLSPGVYDFTDDALARNVMLKPYVGITGIDRDSCIIRRNKTNGTPNTTPVIGLTHGSWLRNFTIDTVDGHFIPYRMGLTERATSQTQAMAGSAWLLDKVAIRNIDPNGIDTGADYDIDSSYYNGDTLLFDQCYFEHCWDGFTWNSSGTGRLKVTFNNPVIYKTPYPDSRNQSGAAFIRAGVTAVSSTDVLMLNPVYDQKTYAAGEVVDDGAGGFIARLGGFTGMLIVGGGATGKVSNPAVDMDVGSNLGRNAGIGLGGTAGTSTLECVGGYINIAGAGGGDAADHVNGAFNDLAGCTLTVCGTKIDAGKAGVRQNNATAVTNLQGGARIKGATNSLVNTAGTMNKSANVSSVGAESGTITSAET